jgi:hypothetical protein
MDGACSTHDSLEEHKIFWFENMEERRHSEGLGIDREIRLEWILG